MKPYLFPIGSCLDADNLILRAKARRHVVDDYAGPLSIKTVVAGQVAWIIKGRELLVDPSSFLVVSAGDKYSMNIDREMPVETCCAFFAPEFVETVAGDMTSPLDRALNQPGRLVMKLPYLSSLHGDCERTIIRQVQTLADSCSNALAPSAFEEAFLVLAGDLLGLYERIREQADRVGAVRSSTRLELFRRLLIGREYFHSHSAGAVSLADVSRAACLSPYHFHRGFTRAFQQTPHTYLTQLRLDRARQLIASGSSIIEACVQVGFSSPSAFSRLFRSWYGVAPSALRRKIARSGKNSK